VSLLDKAKAHKPGQRSREYGEQELDLVLAVLRGEITRAQAAVPVHKQTMYSFMVRVLRTAISTGDIEIVKKKETS
jgi:hypothetical protein